VNSSPVWRRPRAIVFGSLILVSCFAAGCAHHAATATIPPPPKQPSPSIRTHAPIPVPTVPAPGSAGGAGYVEEGIASWYGFPFQGRRAADGEIYDMNQMTAAHRTLPFNSIVRVTNLNNGLQTEVRITDRGPFIEGRIIDLSLAAAKALDVVSTGTAPVRLELVLAGPPELPPPIPAPAGNPGGNVAETPTETPAQSPSKGASAAPASATHAAATPAPSVDVRVGVFAVQIGAFADAARANKLRDQLTANYPSVTVQEFNPPAGPVYRVFVGRYTFEPAAQEVATQLQAEHGYAAFVVRVDPEN